MKFYDLSGIDPHDLGMARPGESVLFTGKGGYPHQSERAHETFTVGQQLTVKVCNIGGFESSYTFEAVDGCFNTVMFDPAIAMEAGTAETSARPEGRQRGNRPKSIGGQHD